MKVASQIWPDGLALADVSCGDRGPDRRRMGSGLVPRRQAPEQVANRPAQHNENVTRVTAEQHGFVVDCIPVQLGVYGDPTTRGSKVTDLVPAPKITSATSSFAA